MATASAQQSVTAVRKAAILLVALGEEASAELMQQLSRSEVKLLSRETSRLRDVSEDECGDVLREFYQLTAEGGSSNKGGVEFTRRLLNRALGADGAQHLLQEVSSPAVAGFAKLGPLVKSDVALVARTLNGEHPQTIALIVAHLPAHQGVSLLAALPSELRGEVALRMARMEEISPDVVAQIAEAVGDKFSGQEAPNREAYEGVRVVADLCNLLDLDTSQEMLRVIEESNPETAERVRKAMFLFEDVLKLDDIAITEVNGRVDRKLLVMALKGTSDQVKEHFTKKMSSRAREMLFEDLDALGPVKIKDVEEAQQEVISVIRQLDQEGIISSRGSSGGGDLYVS